MLYKLNLRDKILLIFIFTMIVLIGILGIFYGASRSSAFQQLSNETDTQQKNAVSILENEFLRINHLQADFLDNNDIKLLTYYKDSLTLNTQLECESNISEKLMYTRLFTSYIDSTYIIWDRDGTADILCKSALSFDEIDTVLELYGKNRLKSRIFYTFKDNIYMIMNNRADVKNGHYITVITKISSKQLINQISGMSDHENSISAISFDGGKVVLCNESTFISNTKAALALKSDKPVINGEHYNAYTMPSKLYNFSVHKLVPQRYVTDRFFIYNTIYTAFIGICILFVIAFYFISKYMITKPLNTMLESFKDAEKGNLDHKIYHSAHDEFSYIFAYYNQMLDSLKIAIKKMNEYAQLKQLAELRQLQAQINPHFLFNSFYTQRRMLKLGDYETLDIFTDHLGKYFEYLHHNETDEISLSEEITHAQNYLSIQELRFKTRVTASFEPLRPEYENVHVPRLIIQPLLENAFAYSVENMTEHALLSVSFEYPENGIFIIVSDNGTVLSDEKIAELNEYIHGESDEITALKNIHRRLSLLYAENSGVYLSRSNGGFCVTLKIFFKD